MHKRFAFGSGFSLTDEFVFSDHVLIRPISFPTDHKALAIYASDQICYGFLCALAHTFSFELEFSGNTDKEVATTEWNNQWLLILLSITMRSPVFFAIKSLRSHKNLEKDCCRIGTPIITPANYRYNKLCTAIQLEQVKEHYPAYIKLLDDKAFAHAATVAALNFNEIKLDMRMAAIWSAIEALLGVEHELNYRIPLLCSLLLENHKDRRLDFFKKVQSLYQVRSKCVHGQGIRLEKLQLALDESHELLCSLIEWTCKNGRVLSPQMAKELPIIS